MSIERLKKLKLENAKLAENILKKKLQVEKRGMLKAPTGSMESFIPKNLESMYNVSWGYFETFTFDQAGIAANESVIETISVSQEAAFVMTHAVKSVFEITGGEAEYIDPYAAAPADRFVPDVSVQFRDAQSQRVLDQNAYEIDHIGDSRFAMKFQKPMMWLPNSVIECRFVNDSANTYVPFITLYGYKIRLEDADRIVSLVTGG